MELTESRKIIIIDLISKFKEDNTYSMWETDFDNIINNKNEINIITEILKYKLKLITSPARGLFRLTEAGIIFSSFKEYETKELKDKLEIDLANSNLEANKLNKKIAKNNAKNEKKNRISTWINIGIGIINVGLLIWQILKAE